MEIKQKVIFRLKNNQDLQVNRRIRKQRFRLTLKSFME